MSGVRIPVRSPLILGISQVGKAHDFDSCMRRFESCIPSHINDSLAQSVEHLTFNQGVRSSNLRRVTIFAFAAQTAGVAELADALDLGSSAAQAYEFKSLRPHQKQNIMRV